MQAVRQKMPQGMLSLYFIQVFSTFAYAVLYSSLSLYLTKQLGLSPVVSNGIVGLFLAFNYVLHLLGGVIGGTYLSNRVLYLITTLIQCIGILFLALVKPTFLYMGLSFFLIGCGLNTTCYNNILNQSFQIEDNRRERAFFWSYAAMNIGFFAGYIISGYYDHHNQYQQLFYLSAGINILTVVLILCNWKYLADQQLIKETNKKRSKNVYGSLMILLLIPLLILCFKMVDISNYLVIVLSIGMFFAILFLGLRQKVKEDKQKIMVYLILMVASIIFWMIYLTGPMGITFYIEHNVNRYFLGYELPTQWILNLNSILIILGAPLLSAIIMRLQAKGLQLSVSTQFIWSFLFLALSFLFFACGIWFADEQGFSSLGWIILHNIAEAAAELLIGPVGYAMIGRIAPLKLQGLFMGTWMMSSGVSASLSSFFSNAMTKAKTLDPLSSNADYLQVFNQFTVWALISSVLLYFIFEKFKLSRSLDEATA